MRHTRMSAATLGAFSVGLALSLAAQSAEQELRPCDQIMHLCKKFGQRRGPLPKGG